MNTAPDPNDHVRHTFFPRLKEAEAPIEGETGRGKNGRGSRRGEPKVPETVDGIPLGCPVEVCWLDALSVAEEWSNPEDVKDFMPEPTVSVGYLWQSEPEFLTLITLVNTSNIGNGLLIPRGCITHVRPLTRGNK